MLLFQEFIHIIGRTDHVVGYIGTYVVKLLNILFILTKTLHKFNVKTSQGKKKKIIQIRKVMV